MNYFFQQPFNNIVFLLITKFILQPPKMCIFQPTHSLFFNQQIVYFSNQK